MTRIKSIFFLLILTTIGLQAQQRENCYQITLRETRTFYTNAQRMKDNGKCDEAVQQYLAAIRGIRSTRDNCRDVPANHELGTWEERCINGIIECGRVFISQGDVYVILSTQSLTFDENGGEQFVAVNSNARSWRVTKSPSWTTSRQTNNGLYVTCAENADASDRKDVIGITANALQLEITIEQKGKTSCYEVRLNECKDIYNDALNLKENGACDEAVRQFLAAISSIRAIKAECRDIPANHELDGGEERCINGIKECGYTFMSDRDTYLAFSPQSLSFEAAGGERSIAVFSNVREWRATNSSSFCSVQQAGNRLIVLCRENTETSARNDVLVITAGALTAQIDINQNAGVADVLTTRPEADKPYTATSLKTGFGAKLGLNLSNINNGTSDILFSPVMKPGVHIGGFFNLRMGGSDQQPSRFGAQGELLFSSQGFKVANDVVGLQYLTLAIMPRFYEKGIYFEVGPWLSFLLASKPDLIEIDESRIALSDLKGGKDAGIAIGLGYELDLGLVVGARYMLGLSDMAKNLPWKNRVIAISVGWKF